MVKVCQQTLDKRVLWRRRQALKQPKTNKQTSQKKKKKKKKQQHQNSHQLHKTQHNPPKNKGNFSFCLLSCLLSWTHIDARTRHGDGRWKMEVEVEARSMWKKGDGEENEWENEPLLCSLCLSLPLLPLVSSEQAKARCTVFAESAERQQQHKR